MSLQPGDRIGDYEIAGILGAGGMGKVYKVRNIVSNRVEALKVLLPDLTGNREVAERFLSEIRVLASFDHPNIAELRTAQRADQQLLMVMELIEGQSLDKLLRDGPIPRARMWEVLARVLDALEYAHARGVVHRDIKPSNIMLTNSGQVKLMDFGIAKKVDKKLTAAGTTLGSVYYMSPEQIQGSENVDARSDLYSLGVVMYEMVTGKKPFDGSSEFSLMSAHLNEAPHPPDQIDPTVPPALNNAVLKALAKDPAQRFQSAAEMRSAIEGMRAPMIAAVRTAEPARPAAAAPVVAAPGNRRGLWVAAGSVATVAVLIAAAVVIPKFFGTEATGEPGAQERPAVQEPAPQTPVYPAPVTPTTTTTPAPAPVETPAVTQAEPRPPEPAPRRETAQAPPPRTVEPPPRTTETAASPAPAPRRETAQPPPARTVEPSPRATETASPPAPGPGAQERASQPEPAAQTPPAPPPGPSRAEMNAIREEYNSLAIRAGTVKTGLQNLQNQMGGLGLRSDMREAATRLDYLMQEAMSSLKSGDIENAKRNLTLADRTAERLEKFLSGR